MTDIRNIDRKRDGYTVKGRIAVNTGNRNWQRGWNNDYRGYNNTTAATTPAASPAGCATARFSTSTTAAFAASKSFKDA